MLYFKMKYVLQYYILENHEKVSCDDNKQFNFNLPSQSSDAKVFLVYILIPSYINHSKRGSWMMEVGKGIKIVSFLAYFSESGLDD